MAAVTRMTHAEAIAAIKANWPTENYTMLREALTLACAALASPPAEDEAMCPDERCACEYDAWGTQMRWCATHPKAPRTPAAVERMAERLAALASPPASDPPGLVEVVAEFQRAHADYQRAKHEDVGQEFAWSARKSARDAVLAYHLPASPQAETKGDE